MSTIASSPHVATLVAGFDTHPAYAGLAESLRGLIADGRLAHGIRLPSERDLAPALGVSRTTVTRAYGELIDRGYAVARRGAGTFARIPGGPTRTLDRALTPRLDGGELIDLNCAAGSAATGLAAAYEEALGELPGYLSGHGYYPSGLPELQAALAATFDARGYPTAPEQILITPGALSATAIAARALVRRGERVLVESPVYPNAVAALRESGGRLVTIGVDEHGWDVAGMRATLGTSKPRAAYLIADFQNPTGHVMSASLRETLGSALARAGTIAVVDEAHQQLNLDGPPMPLPLGAAVEAAGGSAITVGSASKSFWGGLRIGWLRAPEALIPALTQARLALDLGVPVLEQLVMVRLLAEPEPHLAAHRAALRVQRDALIAAVSEAFPEWRFRRPTGGLALWCELPAPVAHEFSLAAERHGVAISPGPLFAP
ncbi:MAG: PLP-dependent aminotransferase family protein, partial [Nocardioides sp.]